MSNEPVLNKVIVVPLVFATCFLITSFAFAQRKTLLYQGSWNGVPCSVTINWDNHSGLGNVNGEIFISGDKAYTFNGSNSAPGQLELTVPGDPVYRFARTTANGKTIWSRVPDGGVTFSRTTGGSGLPGAGGGGSGLPGSGGGSGLPGGGMGIVKPDPKTTTSTGTWGGSQISVTINWDNYAGQGPVTGQIQYNGNAYPFSGSNPRKGYMQITVDGVNGVYQLNKSGTGRSSVWSGSLNGTLLSFSQSGGTAPGAGGLPPGGGIAGGWAIAAEASRDKATADRKASAWRARGFSGACVVHKSQYRSMDGDQNWWITCPGVGSYQAMKNLLPSVKRSYSEAYGIKADQSSRRETFH